MSTSSSRKRGWKEMETSSLTRAAHTPSAVATSAMAQCPFLDEVNRSALDFDLEHVCSVSMATHNVYGCLVCGEYLAGRGMGSAAYFHALDCSHHLFIHLANGSVHCLPDDYAVCDPTLADIKHNLAPIYSPAEVRALDRGVEYVRALDGSDYLSGLIGMNDLGQTDWFNAAFQCLTRVAPLRDYFLVADNYHSEALLAKDSADGLIRRFGELVRKYWNRRNFKGHISPHEFLQSLSKASGKKFAIGAHCDSLEFLSFFLNELRRRLPAPRTLAVPTAAKSKPRTGDGRSSSKRRRKEAAIDKQSMIPQSLKRVKVKDVASVFRGVIEVETIETISETRNDSFMEVSPTTTTRHSFEKKAFFYLLLDLPRVPLFKDGDSYIPQIALTELLSKFDGVKLETVSATTAKRYRIRRLPPFLIVAFRRFKQNQFLMEKNPTIVNFQLQGLDLSPFLLPADGCPRDLLKLSTAKLAAKLKRLGGDSEHKSKQQLADEIVERLEASRSRWKGTRYDLIANLVHSGEIRKGDTLAHVRYANNGSWHKIQDLFVEDCLPQSVAVSEAYIQIWKRTN